MIKKQKISFQTVGKSVIWVNNEPSFVIVAIRGGEIIWERYVSRKEVETIYQILTGKKISRENVSEEYHKVAKAIYESEKNLV